MIHCALSAISVQWLELVYEMATFYHFAKVLEEDFDENESCNLHEGHLWFLDLKKVEIIEKRCAHVHNFNFKCQFNSSDLFKAQSLIIRREIIGTVI